MSFFDRLRPKWKHSDPTIRERGVASLTNQDVLESIVENDPSDAVRLAAVQALTDQDVLAKVARGSTPLAMPAMKKLSDKEVIARVAHSAEQRVVREMAVDLIDDSVTLHRIST